MSTPIEGKLVRLRALAEGDADLLNPKFNDPRVLEGITAVPFPQPKENFEEFRRSSTADPTQENFAIEERATATAIGICGLRGLAMNLSPELGIWLGQEHWNQGFGTDAVVTLCRHAFTTMGQHRVTLHVLAANEGAQRAYEKAGFVLEGTMREDIFARGEWQNVHVMGVLASEFSG